MNNRTNAALYILGTLLILGITYLSFLSDQFEYGSDMLQRPIHTLVSLLVVLGILYLLAIYLITLYKPSSPQIFIWIIAVGIVVRLILIPSAPILEDDYYRYLWDGGVTANGYNPYRYTPNDITIFAVERDVPEKLVSLSEQAGHITQRINHSNLGTVYPPLAQVVFATAHLLKPWSLLSWKIILLLIDGTIVTLLLLLLRKIGTPLTAIAIYWWNPLLLKEIYNSAHMDLLIIPFILLAIWFALQHKPTRSGLALACGAAIKIWPVILAPLLIRYLKISPKQIAISILVSTIILTALFIPVLPAIELDERSGFLAYSDDWEMNDALFMVFDKGVKKSLSLITLTKTQLNRTVRMTVAVTLLICIVILTRRPMQSHHDLLNRLTLTTGIFFMISPTQFPWYYLWILPFLALSPRPSLLILTATLPIYYLKFYYAATNNIDFFHNRIVWIEYTPVFILAAWEARQYYLTPKEPAHA